MNCNDQGVNGELKGHCYENDFQHGKNQGLKVAESSTILEVSHDGHK